MTKQTKNFADVVRAKIAASPTLRQEIDDAAVEADIATTIYEARNRAGITQSELADRIGSHQSVIARLESANYEAHSFSMLKKIAFALDMRLSVDLYERRKASLVSVSTSIEWPPVPTELSARVVQKK